MQESGGHAGGELSEARFSTTGKRSESRKRSKDKVVAQGHALPKEESFANDEQSTEDTGNPSHDAVVSKGQEASLPTPGRSGSIAAVPSSEPALVGLAPE